MSLPCLDGVGVLSTDVRRGLTKAGKRWAGATVRFASRKKAADGSWADDTVIYVSVVGFGLAAEELAAFSKGDTVTVIGKIKALGIWKPERGEPRPSLEMFCEHAAPPPARHAKDPKYARTPEQREGGSQASTPESGRTDRGETPTVATVGTRSTQDRGEPHRRDTGAAAPTDLDAYRREAGERLVQQHVRNAQRAGRLM